MKKIAILSDIHGSWQAEMLAISYEYQKAAAQARKNGRLDWDVGLRTGYMRK